MTSPLPLQIDELSISYGAHKAVDSVGFSLEKGKILGLLGPNGAGKSSLIRVLAGLNPRYSGNVRCFGHRPGELAVRGRISLTPQNSDFASHLKVNEVLRFVASHYPDPLDRESVIESFHLEAFAGRYCRELSGGQKRSLSLAAAFIGNPELIVLDEPSVGLDVSVRRDLLNKIKSFAQSGGSVLLSTHYLDEADFLADQILVMNKGKVVRNGTAAEIQSEIGRKKIRFRSRSTPPSWATAEEEDSYFCVAEDTDEKLKDLMSRSDIYDVTVEPVSLEVALHSILEATQ